MVVVVVMLFSEITVRVVKEIIWPSNRMARTLNGAFAEVLLLSLVDIIEPYFIEIISTMTLTFHLKE